MGSLILLDQTQKNRTKLPLSKTPQTRGFFYFYVMYKSLFSLFFIICFSCSPGQNKIESILKGKNPLIKNVYRNKEKHNLQILYTQIKKDSAGNPEFIEHEFQVADTKYFYPASTMKLPIVALTLQKINELRNTGFDINVESKILLGSDDKIIKDTTFKDLIAKVFLVSDNSASNILINFLG